MNDALTIPTNPVEYPLSPAVVDVLLQWEDYRLHPPHVPDNHREAVLVTDFAPDKNAAAGGLYPQM